MSSSVEWIHDGPAIVLSWHSTYGFDLNNREIASLFWLILFVIWMLSRSDIRASLAGILEVALGWRMLIIWAGYSLWIIAFIWIVDSIGIWQSVLMKDTIVWSTTAGLAILLEAPEAMEPRFFRRKLYEVGGLVVAFEYIANFSSFSLYFELVLQPILAIVLALLITARVRGEEKVRRLFAGVLAFLLLGILGHSVRSLYGSLGTLDIDFLALQFVWPILLGAWVLIFIFPLSAYMNYEESR